LFRISLTYDAPRSRLIPGPKDIIPFAGQRQGREQVAQFIAKLAETQGVQQFETEIS